MCAYHTEAGYLNKMLFGYVLQLPSDIVYCSRGTVLTKLKLNKMSDSDADDSKIPPADECERRCQEFATVTGTDTALAMFYLQDRDWDLDWLCGEQAVAWKEYCVEYWLKELQESMDRCTGCRDITVSFQRALNSYFEEKSAAGTQSLGENVVDLTNASAESSEDKEPYRIRLISWNIDGLDPQNLRSRTLGVCDVIKKEDPHVVFLQEVVENSQEILEDELPMYHVIPGNTEGYYAMMLVKTGHVHVEETRIFDYPTTMMMRNLLFVKCKIKGEKFCMMTSHLESTKEHANERKTQLKKAFSLFNKVEEERTVVFGGDLNLRDNEVTEVGGIPDNVYDIWEVTGKRQLAKFTWDTQRNDNLEWSSKFRPKCRFDRLYVKYSEPQTVKPEYFELIGLERLKSCQRFCSDHWGLLTHFNILSKLPK